MELRLDTRKQRIFAALEGKAWITLASLASASDVTTAFAAKELARLGWKKRTPPWSSETHYFNTAWDRRR